MFSLAEAMLYAVLAKIMLAMSVSMSEMEKSSILGLEKYEGTL